MTRATAFHVGRHGEVAGGMTQVVNGYLSWPFEHFDTAVIASRDGSRGIRALGLAASAAVRLIRLERAAGDVVVVHLSERGSFIREGALLMLAHARGVATVAHLHGSEFAQFARAHPRLVGAVLRSADLVLSLSEQSSEVARRFVPHDAVRLVPNAVPAGNERAKEPIVLFGGSVSRRKGVDVLVDAWRTVSERHPGHGWRLLLAGPIVDREVVPDQLAHADFLGAVKHDDLMELLERSSVAVLPSRDEAMPMFLLEAMARSNAVISTTVGGIPAMLADGVGVLTAPGDVAALAAALEQTVTDPVATADAALRARTAFEASFSATAVFPVVEGAWLEAVGRRGGG